MPPSTGKCNDPARCELSPEISSALERMSLPHMCRFADAKSLLVDKVRPVFASCFLRYNSPGAILP
ncbi:hypothetical protein SMAC4_14030 [Sordaria macrospora]|uniref:uncharacterized protein n=1 Tax=Sordaria macrospora TaxID=5147 RepID=UPI002B30B19A|nr:hypothetical protein SMAC4_14030 [Sordaria macrospora]